MLGINVWVGNLGKYNEGELVGGWISLPASQEEIDIFLKEKVRINRFYEEYEIFDVDADINGLSEYLTTLSKANEIAERIQDLDEDALEAALEIYNLEEAINMVEEGNYTTYSDCYDMTDVAYQVVEDSGLLNNIPENLQCYFDYQAYGRDLRDNGNFVYHDGDYYEFF